MFTALPAATRAAPGQANRPSSKKPAAAPTATATATAATGRALLI